MSAKFTPDQWRVSANVIRIEQAESGHLVCSMPVAQDHKERLAIARLIAAAPDLYTVAKGALGYLESLPLSMRPDEEWLAPLRAAIARAESVNHD